MNIQRIAGHLRPFALTLLAASCLSPAGCGLGGPPASDPEQGRTMLQTALDAWKSGQAPADLASQAPPVHVTDGDWKSGMKLQGFEFQGDARTVGSDVQYRVKLDLKTARGQALKREATYSVTTQPQRLIIRQDEV